MAEKQHTKRDCFLPPLLCPILESRHGGEQQMWIPEEESVRLYRIEMFCYIAFVLVL